MAQLFRFFSFAVLTQLVLLLNQVVLLPIQLRQWGVATTATWYAAIALATMTTFADLGLRTASHVELLRFVRDRDEAAGAQLQQVWGWIRVLVCALTLFLLLWSALDSWFHADLAQTLWKDCLTLAYAIETLLIVRIVYLDSLGHYSTAESTYFTFAVLRLGLALPALLVFHAQPQFLGALYLANFDPRHRTAKPLLQKARYSRIVRSAPSTTLFRRTVDCKAHSRGTAVELDAHWLSCAHSPGHRAAPGHHNFRCSPRSFRRLPHHHPANGPRRFG